jgi:shikimate dehydrogenase
MTRSVALLGYPLGHSISPVFQQAAFEYYQLDIHYEPWEVQPYQLEQTVNRLREETHPGANVTIPHKQTVIPLMDSLDDLARQIGAVNTIVNQEEQLIGHNTDAAGFLRALQQEGGFDPKGKVAVILGAGGAARAVSFALVRAKVGSIAIAELLIPQKATELADSLKTMGGVQISILPWEEPALATEIANCDLLINCTPMGMKHSQDEHRSPVKAHIIPDGVLVYDVVYNPPETPLLKEARQAGARTLGGLSMLVYQGAISFELWTGKQAPVDLMFKVAQNALT